MLMSYDVILT